MQSIQLLDLPHEILRAIAAVDELAYRAMVMSIPAFYRTLTREDVDNIKIMFGYTTLSNAPLMFIAHGNIPCYFTHPFTANKIYLKHGKLHRTDGPAIVVGANIKKDTPYVRGYFQNGISYRSAEHEDHDKFTPSLLIKPDDSCVMLCDGALTALLDASQVDDIAELEQESPYEHFRVTVWLPRWMAEMTHNHTIHEWSIKRGTGACYGSTF